ncbi:PIN domain-like protein [Rhodofomes roseus]|uniref:PIN domain-like protein n=1 Tax=Rhodofomes roseus TaxID=34475 RepID=A0ABQ8KPD1_9APHY|nr:PIN domain-like protein [Rhodofomes roseus]KAH9840013.1 PIN domain-like protein [Rhodofomes roseus]
MGVRGLWEVLQPASTQESIEDYFMREGIVRRQRGERVYRLGIDTSIWFHQVQNTFAVGHAQSGENPELRTLFYRLARLLRLHVHAIFVFDGPDRPAEKRGRRVVPAGHWMVEAMKGFIDAFGYAYWTAPGEAEAELALFNQAGFIDGVLTDDGDAFLFGARTVIRNFDAKATTLTITRAESVLTHNAVSLSRPGMILFALLSGGDYDEGGLPGFGPRVALGLARYQFGETLCQAVRMHWHGDLSQVLSDWRNNMRQTLCSDPQNLLGRRYHRLSTQIPDTFPNPDIIDSYIHPVTSPYEDFEVPPLQPPNIARLGALCERYFSWGTVPGIIERFGNCVLPGVVVRVLINQTVKHDELCVTKDTYEDPLEPLIQVDRDSRRRRGARTIAVVDTGFAAAATSALLGLRPVDDNHPRPASLHYVVLPKLLIPFVWDSDRETTTRGM